VVAQWGFAVLNGFASGMGIFIVAAGLTWLFGILKILNMAHGAFMMIGAYVAFSIIGRDPDSVSSFIGAAIAAAVVCGALGYITDRLVFRRLREVDYHYVLIATFALVMICEGVAKLIWGSETVSIMPPPLLDEPLQIGPLLVPAYTLFLIGAGLAVAIVLEIVVNRLFLGKIMQTLAADVWIAGVLGINVPLALMLSVVASFGLVGLAGGLMLPNQSLSPYMGDSFLILAFFSVIIGGLGNIRGAFCASILLGLVQNVAVLLVPSLPGLSIYVVLAIFLIWMPNGLFPARQALAHGAATHNEFAHGGHRLNDWQVAALLAAAFAVAASLPFWVGQGVLFLAGLALIQALFATSWNLLFGYTGLASFGHAGFFAAGAYFTGAALHEGYMVPFPLLLVLSAGVGAALAFIVGCFAMRRMAGIFLAVLTVSLSEVLRLVISYSPRLGREDGLGNIPRPSLGLFFTTIDLAPSESYYWFLLVVVSAIMVALWWLLGSGIGRVFQSIRQDAERVAFIGVNVAAYRLAAFMISGAVAATAGALFAPWTRIVTLAEADLLASTQPMLSTLLGGAGTFWGPTVGAIVFSAINYATRTYVGLSEVIVGTILLLVILAAPSGIIGLLNKFTRRMMPRASLPRGGVAAVPAPRAGE
jgi:ABC-type branched-subunit amino acid transport system permease subunit